MNTAPEIAKAIEKLAESKSVEHPDHYQGKGLEVIEVIEAFDLGFSLGNCIKYILRAGKKGDAVEDLLKARWYLERHLEKITRPGG